MSPRGGKVPRAFPFCILRIAETRSLLCAFEAKGALEGKFFARRWPWPGVSRGAAHLGVFFGEGLFEENTESIELLFQITSCGNKDTSGCFDLVAQEYAVLLNAPLFDLG